MGGDIMAISYFGFHVILVNFAFQKYFLTKSFSL